MSRIGPGELLLLLLICLLLWGPTRLPDMGRSLGRSIAEFRRGLRGDDDEGGKPAEPTSETGSSQK